MSKVYAEISIFDHALQSGEMKKKNFLHWTTYYFVLYEKLLCYYSNLYHYMGSKTKPKELIYLDNVTINYNTRHQYIEIEYKNKQIILSMHNKSDLYNWYEAILMQSNPFKSNSNESDSYDSVNSDDDTKRIYETANTEDIVEKTINGTVFSLPKKYDVIKHCGSGSFGVVALAHDIENNISIAVKKSKNLFNDLVDTKYQLREIRLLRTMEHPNIISILDMYYHLNDENDIDDIYIMMPSMETSLHRVIYSQLLTDGHRQYIMYQIFCALKYIHSAGIIHRDLKPSNVLINSDCFIKICDFGLARRINIDPITGNTEEKMTEYVITRWYRAPEVMLNAGYYTQSIDVWGAGCILAEMVLRKPFIKARNYIEQLHEIFKRIGTPTNDSEIEFLREDSSILFVKNLPKTSRINFEHYFNSTHFDEYSLDRSGIQLLNTIFVLNPKKRITVQKALEHKYHEDFRYSDNAEVERPEIITLEDIDKPQNLNVQRLSELFQFEQEQINNKMMGNIIETRCMLSLNHIHKINTHDSSSDEEPESLIIYKAIFFLIHNNFCFINKYNDSFWKITIY